MKHFIYFFFLIKGWVVRDLADQNENEHMNPD